jgi:nucleoside-diphosphate-sugar epimerase
MVLRLSNPYGPHPREGAFAGFGIVNYFIDLALKGESIRLYGDGSQLRDFVFIDDVVDALIAAASAPVPGAAVNVGYGAGASLAEAARLSIETAGSGSVEMVPWPDDAAAVETGDFYFDITRAKELLGWAPQVSLKDGLERTIAEMRA